jgi:hypothetical protein
MIAYFKHTQGEAFTLNDVPYVGFFNITNNEAYTGKIKTDLSEKLSPQKTFISDFYLNKMEFDNQYDSVVDVTSTNSNVFDIFNTEELNKLLTVINHNNLIVFKSLIVSNPLIVDFDDNNSHYYGLSSTPVDMRNDDLMVGKRFISHIDPFRNSPEWEFLDRIKYGTFFVKSDQTFKYLCSTGYDLIIIKGSFVDGSYIEYTNLGLEMPQEVFQISYNEDDNKIAIIINNELKIYDSINFIECDTLVLIDSIRLGDIDSEILKWSTKKSYSSLIGKWNRRFWNNNTANIDFFKFGNNYRTSLENNVLTLWNKYTFEAVSNINLGTFGITNVLDVDIRTVDDLVMVLHSDGSNFKVSFFDPSDVINTFVTRDIQEFNVSNDYRVTFSNYDSNIFFINSRTQSHTRLISKPTYPVGAMREENLQYPRKAKWGDMYQKFGNSVLKWNTSSMDSNFYTNYRFETSSKNGRNYFLLHNSGRIYPIQQDISKAYQSAIDMNTEKYYDGVHCGDHSFGLFFNKTISSILKDILNLYTKATNAYILDKNDVFLTKIDEITYETNNLYMNGNESVNIITIGRILNLLMGLQKKLIANLIS